MITNKSITPQFNSLHSSILKNRSTGEVHNENTWTTAAKMFDLDIEALDQIAFVLGYKNYEGLEFNITPRELLRAKAGQFVKALQSVSEKAAQMEMSEVINAFAGLWDEPINVINTSIQ